MSFIVDFSFLILDSLVPITSKSIFALCKRYSGSSTILGREYVFYMKNTQSIFLIFIIKILNFFSVIILAVNDIFSVFILLRTKIIEYIEEVT